MMETYRLAMAWPWPCDPPPEGGIRNYVPDGYPYETVIGMFDAACAGLPQGTRGGRSDSDQPMGRHVVVDVVLTTDVPDPERSGRDHRLTRIEDFPAHLAGTAKACLDVLRAVWADAAEAAGKVTMARE